MSADPRPTVGVLDLGGLSDPAPADPASATDPLFRSLRMSITLVELRRRLIGFDLRAFTPGGAAPDWQLGPDAVESLDPWGGGSAVALQGEVDALVVLPGPVGPEGGRALDELKEADLPIHWLAAGEEDPDPLVLAGRLADDRLLAARREYLVVTGQLPADRDFVLCLPADSAGPSLDREVHREKAVFRPAPPPSPIDLLGVVSASDAVVTSSPAVLAIAVALARPVAHGGERAAPWARGLPTVAPTGPEKIRPSNRPRTGHPAGDEIPDEPPSEPYARFLAEVTARADRCFDEAERALVDCAGRRIAQTTAQRLDSLQRRVATLGQVNSGLRAALGRERTIMAAEIRRHQGKPADVGPWSAFAIERLQQDLTAAHHALNRLQAEIDGIYATRTMRTVAPLRRVYGRLRRLASGRL